MSKAGLEEEWYNSPSPSPPSWDTFSVPSPRCCRKHVTCCQSFVRGYLHSQILLVNVPWRTKGRCLLRTCCSHFEVGDTMTNADQRKKTYPVHLNADNRLQARVWCLLSHILLTCSHLALSLFFPFIISRKMYQSRRITPSKSCPSLLTFFVFISPLSHWKYLEKCSRS